MGGNYALGFTINVNLVVFKLTVYIETQQPKKKNKNLYKTLGIRMHLQHTREFSLTEADILCSFSVDVLGWWMILM